VDGFLKFDVLNNNLFFFIHVDLECGDTERSCQPVETKPKEKDSKNEQKHMNTIMHPKLLITPLQIWNNSLQVKEIILPSDFSLPNTYH
jgi:hypothetical protein